MPGGEGYLRNLTKEEAREGPVAGEATGLQDCPEDRPCRLQPDHSLTGYGLVKEFGIPGLSFHHVAVWVVPHIRGDEWWL